MDIGTQLTFIQEKEFMSSRTIFKSNNISCSRSIYSHRSSNLVPSSHTSQFITRPNSKYCPHREICVNDTRTIEGIKCYTKSSCILEDISKDPSYSQFSMIAYKLNLDYQGNLVYDSLPWILLFYFPFPFNQTHQFVHNWSRMTASTRNKTFQQ